MSSISLYIEFKKTFEIYLCIHYIFHFCLQKVLYINPMMLHVVCTDYIILNIF